MSNFKYTKEQHPKSIRIDMDYCADPIWCEMKGGVYANSDKDFYPFPKDVLHLLECYQNLWEDVMSTKYLDIGETFEDEVIGTELYNILQTMETLAASKIKRWCLDNEWDMKVYVCDHVTNKNIEVTS